MPQRVEERLRPITPQLAWRVAVLGGVAFVLFGIVFFRLWYLQVLTGEEARVSASQNGRRIEKIEAPRGDIVDRNRVPLVQTKRAAVIQLVPSTLPKQVRDDLYRRISEVIKVSPRTIHARVIRGIADAPYSNVTIRTDVPQAQFDYM